MCRGERPEYTHKQKRAINTGIAQSICGGIGGIVSGHVPTSLLIVLSLSLSLSLSLFY